MSDRRRCKILVVEDDDDIRDSLKELLEEEGYRVDTAANGQQALVKLQEQELPQLILLDLMMPVMDGFELLERLRNASGPSTVVLSASREADRVRNHPLVKATLGKPVEVDVLLGLLDELRPKSAGSKPAR